MRIETRLVRFAILQPLRERLFILESTQPTGSQLTEVHFFDFLGIFQYGLLHLGQIIGSLSPYFLGSQRTILDNNSS